MQSKTIPLSIPTIRGNEWKYIRECLDTNWVSYLGPFVDRFERELAACCGADFAVATASGTAALHLALMLAGVQPETEVIMPAMSFVAPANAVRYCGAWPTLIDQREADWQLDVEKLADFFAEECVRRDGKTFNRTTGRRISALLPVHLFGDMCDVDAVARLAAEYDLPVVEDAAECMGATYKGREIATPLPEFDPARRQVITSFNGNKVITTGGGGAILCSDERIAERARHLSTTAKAHKVRFDHDEIGYNYRLTNVAAAMGVAQLEQLDDFVAAKRSHASKYRRAFEGQPEIATNPQSALTRSTYWMYTIVLDRPAWPVIESLNAAGITSRPAWTPIHRLPKFEGECYSYRCEFTEKFFDRALSLPCSVGITDDEIERVASAVLDLFEKRLVRAA